MKIIHVAHRAEEYGIGTFLFDLVSIQRKMPDCQIEVAFHAMGPRNEKFVNLGIPLHVLGYKSARDPRLLFRFVAIFRSAQIVNLHTFSPWAFLAAFILRKKIVYTFHGALGLRNKKSDALIRIYHRRLVNRYCRKITFASRSSLNRYLNGFHCSFNEKRMMLMSYGIDIQSIAAHRLRVDIRQEMGITDLFVIGTAARMDPMKRLDRLIDSFSLLENKKNYKLLIMGKGDERYEEEMRNRVKRNGLETYVTFLGFRSDVRDLINTLDLFVLPSKDEPFGLALLEAMALGIPSAVFSDGGGPVDIIGDSGFVVKDSRELADVICRLHKDPGLRSAVSLKVRSRSREFDIGVTAGKLHRLYREILQ